MGIFLVLFVVVHVVVPLLNRDRVLNGPVIVEGLGRTSLPVFSHHRECNV
jgi:hypothetical protein